ncbi:MAG: ParA family protein [Bdellovibrionales bacterium]|nr:ParA family protein [Bdellovibrionales bacterium]
MLKVVVLDRSAESRSRIVEQLNSFVNSDLAVRELMPRMSIQPLSPEEIKFNAAPDLCIIGEEVLSTDLTEIGNVRKTFQNTPILARLEDGLSQLALIEQIARLGADDVISQQTTAAEFYQKVILLTRRGRNVSSGKLILVESAKGGAGVTTLVAGMAEQLIELGKKVVVLDLDFETQDLSRFLQAKPFINENLQLLFDKQRPVIKEFVEQCLVKVWQDAELYCMPPVADSDKLYDLRGDYSRVLLSVLELLDAEFDCIIVDSASARGVLLKALYRVADKVVTVVNSDPATLYAAVDRLTRLRSAVAVENIVLVDNASSRFGMPAEMLRREFNRVAQLDEQNWSPAIIPFCRQGSRWPASGGTIFSEGHGAVLSGIKILLNQLSLMELEEGLVKPARFLSRFTALWRRREQPSKEQQILLPTERPGRMQGPSETNNQRLELPSPEDLVGAPSIADDLPSENKDLRDSLSETDSEAGGALRYG